MVVSWSGKWRSRVVLAPFFILCFFQANVSGEASALRQVTVQIPGGPDKLSGLTARRDPDGHAFADLLEPHQITLKTTDGALLSVTARSSSIVYLQGELDAVTIRRPMQPARFQKIKADLLATLARLGIAMDSVMSRDLSTWQGDVAGFGEGVIPQEMKTGLRTPFQGLVIDVRAVPDPAGGWFYLLIFSPVSRSSMPGLYPVTQPANDHGVPAHSVTVKMLAPFEIGAYPGDKVSAKGFSEVDMLDPQFLTLEHIDHTHLEIKARSVHVMYMDGKVATVFARLPGNPASFDEARAGLLQTLDGLKVTPDRVMKLLMANWDTDRAACLAAHGIEGDYQAALGDPFHGEEFTVRICRASEGKWYTLLIFSDPSL